MFSVLRHIVVLTFFCNKKSKYQILQDNFAKLNVRTSKDGTAENVMRYYDLKNILFTSFPVIFNEHCFVLKHFNDHICSSLTLQWLINFIRKSYCES